MPLLLPQIRRARRVRQALMRQRGAQAYKTVYAMPGFRGRMEGRVLIVSEERTRVHPGPMPARTVGQASILIHQVQYQWQHAYRARPVLHHRQKARQWPPVNAAQDLPDLQEDLV